MVIVALFVVGICVSKNAFVFSELAAGTTVTIVGGTDDAAAVTCCFVRDLIADWMSVSSVFISETATESIACSGDFTASRMFDSIFLISETKSDLDAMPPLTISCMFESNFVVLSFFLSAAGGSTALRIARSIFFIDAMSSLASLINAG